MASVQVSFPVSLHFLSFGFLFGFLPSTCSLFGSFASRSRWCSVAGLCMFFCCFFAPTSAFVLSLSCYPSFVGWFLTCFASSSSSVCCVSGFLLARSVSCFLPLDFLVLFRPLLPLSLCVFCLRLFTVRLSCSFLYWEYLSRFYFSAPLLASSCLAASLLAVGVCPGVWCRLVCSVCSLLSSVRCSYPPAAFSCGSSQFRLFLCGVAGSPAAPVVTPPLCLPLRLWSSTSPVSLLWLRWSLLPFFSASHVLARLYPISTLPEHLHSTSLSHAKTT